MAAVRSQTGGPEIAAALLGAAESLRGAIGTPVPPCERPVCETSAERLSGQLGDGTSRVSAYGGVR
jgi:hypothetical protein